MVRILSGESLARQVLLNLKKKRRKNLCLAVVQVGENLVSLKYIAEKEKVAKDLGIRFCLMLYPATVSQAALARDMKKLGKDKKVSGIIVQLPLPKHLDTQSILDAIPQTKDVDVLSSSSFAEFVFGTFPVLPPTVAAISLLLKKTKKKLEGTQVAVVGAGRLVGLPVSLWLTQQGAVVSLIQKGTKNTRQLIKKADIVISGVGKAGLITGAMIKKGAVVIDAGTSVESGKTAGDVDFKSVSKKAGYLSPVPGGVGPLTVVCLLANLIELANTSKKWK
ncbi:MAG: bifunctional 5,10-methylenetetrahydrofolate dehydrogenase/5,10-methenyltetrahydrofolate cyclohydrolase [Candidatus Wildermuthbacteria bacterium]|nr:bifunctional 5,10-methylenetetrahydrofolate dehydrogenase/5,10-methenyltetrahydrofolate cyclohydrolase [Candidatus Wildermuthbacteria bacterium]